MGDYAVKKRSGQKTKIPLELGIVLQLFMTFITTIFIIVAFFKREYFSLLEFLLGLNLFVLSFNNFKYYKRYLMTWVYMAAGAAMILVSILKWCDIL